MKKIRHIISPLPTLKIISWHTLICRGNIVCKFTPTCNLKDYTDSYLLTRLCNIVTILMHVIEDAPTLCLQFWSESSFLLQLKYCVGTQCKISTNLYTHVQSVHTWKGGGGLVCIYMDIHQFLGVIDLFNHFQHYLHWYGQSCVCTMHTTIFAIRIDN